MASVLRQVSADSGVGHCSPHDTDTSTDHELTFSRASPHPNSRFSDETSFKSQVSQSVLSADAPEGAREQRSGREALDYTAIALFLTVSTPFGAPALYFARKCRKEVRRGNVAMAWRYSWLALQFILAGLMFFCLVFVVLGVWLNVKLYYDTRDGTPTNHSSAIAVTTADYPTTSPLLSGQDKPEDSGHTTGHTTGRMAGHRQAFLETNTNAKVVNATRRSDRFQDILSIFSNS